MLINRVKEVREIKGMTQAELAEKAEVARAVVSDIETNKKDVITTKTMLKISHALDAPADEIFLLNKSTIVNKEE